MHVYPFVVPEQFPARNWFTGHTMLLQGLQTNPFVDPVHVPERYWLVAQVVLEHGAHARVSEVLPKPHEPETNWPGGQVGDDPQLTH